MLGASANKSPMVLPVLSKFGIQTQPADSASTFCLPFDRALNARLPREICHIVSDSMVQAPAAD
jgi:hypothetical protein